MRRKRLQDTTHAIRPPVIFWNWRMAQRYANCLLIKLLRALLGNKTRIP